VRDPVKALSERATSIRFSVEFAARILRQISDLNASAKLAFNGKKHSVIAVSL
jgi:hypothetical protein